jgi:hypothetical protein
MPQDAPEDTYERLRRKWLNGELVAAAASHLGSDDVVAVLTEFRVGGGVATLVGAEDGTASLYLSTGGGIIGMGFHASTAAASLALVGCARSYLEVFPAATTFPLPEPGRRALRIITRAGVHSAEFVEKELRGDLLIAPLAMAAEHLMTNVRLLDQQRMKGGIRSHTVHVHVFPDGGVCVLVAPDATGTWLTAVGLKKVLEVARTHDDRLQADIELGDSELQAPVSSVLAQSGLSRAPGATPRLLSYAGGTTTLLSAVEDSRPDLVEEAVQRGVNLEAKDARGYTALILAAYRGRTPLLRFLVQAGANVNARDRHGNSVLSFAAQQGDLEAVKLLVASGADLNIRGQNGYTALKIAKLSSHPEVAWFLQAQGAAE